MMQSLQTWYFFFQAEDGIRDYKVTGVQTCALPIFGSAGPPWPLPFFGLHGLYCDLAALLLPGVPPFAARTPPVPPASSPMVHRATMRSEERRVGKVWKKLELQTLSKNSKRDDAVFANVVFFFSSRRRHTRLQGDWSSDVCSSDLRVRRAAVALALLRLARLVLRLGGIVAAGRAALRREDAAGPAGEQPHGAQGNDEIGRASCRESVEKTGTPDSFEEFKKR